MNAVPAGLGRQSLELLPHFAMPQQEPPMLRPAQYSPVGPLSCQEYCSSDQLCLLGMLLTETWHCRAADPAVG